MVPPHALSGRAAFLCSSSSHKACHQNPVILRSPQPTKSALTDGSDPRRTSPHARGELDDLDTSLMRDGARWAAPRTARRAVVGLGVARRPAWFRHAAPIVTRGGHAFTEAGRVHGSWRAPRGDDSRPRHPVAREWDATPVDSVRRLVRPHAPIVIPALRLVRVPARPRRAPCSCPPVCVLICLI